jgi:predicted ATP-grasp superfamily ATP-dependent carboligase
VASLAVSEHNDRVQALGLRFLESISYRGVGAAEFKYDPEADLYRLIELNCRTWMQNAMCTVAGLNLPLIQYADLTDQAPPSAEGFRDGVRWWDGLADLDSLIRMRRRGELSTSAWIRSWLGCDCQAFYSRGDLRPALKRIGGGVEVMKTLVHALRRDVDEDAKVTWHRT